jgi:hypothetical protein
MITNFFIFLLLSILLSFGLSVALVEKGKEWPIRKYNILMRLFLRKYVNRKFSRVLKCTVCTSFWITLVSDICIMVLSVLLGSFYFFWPFSGFIVLGFTWFIIQFLDALDNKDNIPEINNIIVKEEEN